MEGIEEVDDLSGLARRLFVDHSLVYEEELRIKETDQRMDLLMCFINPEMFKSMMDERKAEEYEADAEKLKAANVYRQRGYKPPAKVGKK